MYVLFSIARFEKLPIQVHSKNVLAEQQHAYKKENYYETMFFVAIT